MHYAPKHSRWSRVAALLSLVSIYCAPIHAETLASIKQVIRKRFPTVPQISTADLDGLLADPSRAPVLIDARSPQEFAVSHLKGARNLRSSDEVRSAIHSHQQSIVVYCSVGYRSSALAAKLQEAGFTNVLNLEGSIFEWANEGRPVFRGTNQVHEVHPYSRKWGQLLDPKLRAKY